MADVISFNKRISLVKKEVFEGVIQSGELDNIKGTRDTGFYSIKTITKSLHPALEKYNLDLDLDIYEDKIIGHWYDGESDKEREIPIDFHRVKDVERLQLMANIVQSEGAVKSYTRRYALTAILNLPSTDIIDNPDFKGTRENNNKTTEPKKVSEAQLKRYFAIAKKKEFDIEYLDELVETAFAIRSKKDLTINDYKNLTDYMEKNSSQDTNSMLIKKIIKGGKKVPEKK